MIIDRLIENKTSTSDPSHKIRIGSQENSDDTPDGIDQNEEHELTNEHKG